MNIKDQRLSHQFYNFLCDIIGCHTVVRTRRAIFTGKDIVERNTIKTCISSGSKAEGLDLQGSDYDTMFLSNRFRVNESFGEAQSTLDANILYMETDEIKAGFTKLFLVDKSNI